MPSPLFFSRSREFDGGSCLRRSFRANSDSPARDRAIGPLDPQGVHPLSGAGFFGFVDVKGFRKILMPGRALQMV